MLHPVSVEPRAIEPARVFVTSDVRVVSEVRLVSVGLLGVIDPEVRRARVGLIRPERPTISHEDHVRLGALPFPTDTDVVLNHVEATSPDVLHAVAPRVVGVRRVRPLARGSSVILDRQIAPFEHSRVAPVSPIRIGVSRTARARDEREGKQVEPPHWHTPLTQLMPFGQAWKIEEQVVAHEPSRLPVRSRTITSSLKSAM